MSATPRRVMPDKGWRVVLARESECAKAAILRSRRKFRGNRYHAAAGFVTEKSGVSRKFQPMELVPVHAGSSPIHLVIYYSRPFARSKRPRKSFAATPAIVLTDRGAINGAIALEEPTWPVRPFTCAR